MFKLKTIGIHDPLVEDPFHAWLCANAKKDASFGNNRRKYLESLGFKVGEDFITPRQLDILNHVEEYWCCNTPWFSTPCKFDELFVPGEDFYLDPKGRTGITPKLRQMVEESRWVQEVMPTATFFRLLGTRLYAEYQQILGGRYLCDIEE